MARRSAADEAARYILRAELEEFAAAKSREMARRYEAAAESEGRLGEMLLPLTESGYFLLTDRVWPGSSKANVDFILVGPTGVFIVDAKAWGRVHIERERVFQGQDDVTERLRNIGGLGTVVESALAEIGLAPGEVHVVAVFMGARYLRGRTAGVDLIAEDGAPKYFLERGERLNPAQVRTALAVVENLFLPYAARFQNVELTKPDAVVPTTLERALISVDEIERALLAGILKKPIEDWMAFLHPDQARLVRRSFNGPSRIRGAAGTGKTVVGLHRAAYLARTRPGTVLVTTLVKTLPNVLSSLLQRMAPEVAERVEFAGIHSFARAILSDRGVAFTLDTTRADLAFDRAWASVGKSGGLAKIDKAKDYWKDEVISVIKGRGLTDFDQYAALARVGRRRGLTGEQRFAVWELHTRYDAELRADGIHDFADIILLAEKSIRTRPLVGYSAVIVDEAQDLSCAMIRMLHAIVGDAPDGFNLIGDGQQTIYPGGYTLSEANVSIAGRGVIMTRNYRNTVEIAALAASLVVGDEFADIEGTATLGGGSVEVVRHGAKPRVSRFSTRAGHDRSLVEQVQSLILAGSSFGDIGILAPTNFAVRDIASALDAVGIPTIDLTLYTGTTGNQVKVGTIKRAKGLEFKQVLVARTSPKLLDAADLSADSVATERLQLDRRELYVAMTRARDGLWVGVA